MTKPRLWSLEQLKQKDPDATMMMVTASVYSKAVAVFPFATIAEFPDNHTLKTLVVIGGGTLIDKAKAWRAEKSLTSELIVIPSIWGSGAEVSPIAVINHNQKKEIKIGEQYLPDIRVIWPELCETLPENLARRACGDTWSHALEVFISPLANESLQQELAILIAKLMEINDFRHSDWFELSGQACAAQARASVGLIHGIAHVVEPMINDVTWGHARLCSTLLWPVLCFNRQHSDKWQKLSQKFQLDQEKLSTCIRSFYREKDFEQILPLIIEHWRSILRDPCTRVNGVLVRPAHLSYFKDKSFS